MKEFITYIEDACKDVKYSEILYQYKRNLLDEMNDRACDVQQAGLKDNNVIADLIKSEYPDIRSDYDRYFAAEKKRRKESLQHKLLAIGGPILIILAVALYIVQGVLFKTWGDGRWLIIVGAAFAVSVLAMLAGIRKIMRLKKIFHPIARVLTAGCIMLVAVFVFLWSGTHIGWDVTWPIVPGGVIALLLGDLAFAYTTHQKFSMINTFVYIPAISAMVYVILAAFDLVSWSKGWLLILLGIALDAIIGLLILLDNAKYRYKQEVEDIWNEN